MRHLKSSGTMYIKVIIILLFASSCYGQNYNRDINVMLDPLLSPCSVATGQDFSTLNKGVSKSPIEKIIWTEVAVIGYGVADYFLYNSIKNTEQYRFIQGIMFAGINYLLYKYVSVSSSIGFSVQCLFATPDMVYYGMDKMIGEPISRGNEFAINKSYSHLNFIPLAWGQEKAKGLDVVASNILGTAFSILIQF